MRRPRNGGQWAGIGRGCRHEKKNDYNYETKGSDRLAESDSDFVPSKTVAGAVILIYLYQQISFEWKWYRIEQKTVCEVILEEQRYGVRNVAATKGCNVYVSDTETEHIPALAVTPPPALS